MNSLPFRVSLYSNRSGSPSWRVSGMRHGQQIRKNFATEAEALAVCGEWNAQAVEARTVFRARVAQTSLSDADLAAGESAVTWAAGRWSLKEILEAGKRSLKAAPKVTPLPALRHEWLELVKEQVNSRWLNDLRSRTGRFVQDNPTWTTADLTRDRLRTWLDRLDAAVVTKSHYRGCLHKFFDWLVERGYLAENPASKIRIGRKRAAANDEAAPPTVLDPVQAAALAEAFSLPQHRRALGWFSLCLFAGLRPEAEAPHLKWSEIDFKTGEIRVMGRKRGARLRTFVLSEQALAWLRVVQRTGAETPGAYSRAAQRGAVAAANAILKEKRHAPIVWVGDILRHTHASVRSSSGTPVHTLAADMGTSADMIYRHYRHPRPAAEVRTFVQILPARQIA